jgi:hypothetical protein
MASIEIFCFCRSSLRIRTTSAQVASRNLSFGTAKITKKQFDGIDDYSHIFFMFIRRLGNISAPAQCAGGHSCPDLLELESGDFAVIGADITEEARGKLPPGSGCGPAERIVMVPRKTLVQARPDIPANL